MKGEKIFWLVISHHQYGLRIMDGCEPLSESAARQTAKKWAKEYPNTKFYIVKAQEYFESTGMQNTILLYPQEDTDVTEKD